MTIARSRIGTLRLTGWLVRYGMRRWRNFLAVIGTMLPGIGLEVLKPWPLAILIDHVLKEKPFTPTLQRVVAWLPGAEQTETLLAWCVAGTVMVFLLGWLFDAASKYAGIGFGQRLTYDLAADLFSHLQRLSLGFHSRSRLGDSIRRVTTDSRCVSTLLNSVLLPVVSALVTLGTMFFIMWQLNAWLTLVSLFVLPLMAFAFRRYAGPMLESSYAQQAAESSIYNVIEQTLTALPVVQAFGREDVADHRFRQSTAATVRTLTTATAIQVKFKVMIGFATALGTATIFWLAARAGLAGELSVGTLVVFLSYLQSLYSPLNAIMYSSTAVQNATASAQRVHELLDMADDVREAPEALPLPKVQGHIRIEHVTFGYAREQPFLHDISLEVKPGETVALVGATGAGKSTLAGLVARFHDPWEGAVSIDGTDIRQVQLASLRSQVAFVLQEAFLFPITLAENIAYGRPNATPEEVEAAARAANAHEFIAKLPRGYQTVVGERGATLSGGERQRISIARALLKDAPILILDEPTSALDVQTESLLLGALERLMAGRTTLIIAHRLSTIRRADRIAVIDQGRVAEIGPHGELIRQGGLYARLHAVQFRGT